MKKYLLLLLSLVLLAGCQKDAPVMPTDPLPFPTDINKDLSVKPGDNFFYYCNGTWLKNATIPEGKKIYGGLFVIVNTVRDRKAAFFEEDPMLSRLMAFADDPQAREKNQAYIEKLLAMVPEPENATIDDYVRLVGKLHCMGVEKLLEEFHMSTPEGIIIPWLIPLVFADITVDKGAIVPEPGAPKSKRFMELLSESVGIDPSLPLLSEKEIEGDDYAICMLVDKATLCNEIKKVIKSNDYSIDKLKEKINERARIYTEYLYTKKYVPAGTKEKYTAVCERLRTQYRKRIQALDWMSDATKTMAIEKLDAMKFNVAYPDNWREHVFPTLAQVEACSSLLEAYMLLNAGNSSFFLDLCGKNVKDCQIDYWLACGQSLTDPGASYDTQTNAVYICSSLLVPPLISPDVTEAYTYAVFNIIGHEMTHGFDTDGVNYDKDGKEKNWWTAADKAAFEERQKMLVECYNQLEIDPDLKPGVFCNGTVTLEENIADLGGVCLALDAYTERLQQQGFTGEALKAQQRKFFECFADIWCCKYGTEFIDSRIEGNHPDKHALPRERINGVVRNIDLWYDLYNVDPSNKLYLSPERRTRIW